MTVSQLPAIRRLVTSVVALYPPCDFTVSHHQKSRLRRYKPQVGGFRAKDTDYMLSMAPMIDWSYLPQGTELRNPLLSPYFADHEMLPQRVFIVGCEMDMFAHEAWRTICKLAGRDIPSFETPVGREAPFGMGHVELGGGAAAADNNDDGMDRFHFEQRYGDGSSYKWLLVPDTIHNFDQRIGGVIRDVDFRADAEQKSETVMREIGDWIAAASYSAHDGGVENGAAPAVEGAEAGSPRLLEQ